MQKRLTRNSTCTQQKILKTPTNSLKLVQHYFVLKFKKQNFLNLDYQLEHIVFKKFLFWNPWLAVPCKTNSFRQIVLFSSNYQIECIAFNILSIFMLFSNYYFHQGYAILENWKCRVQIVTPDFFLHPRLPELCESFKHRGNLQKLDQRK